MTHEQSPRSCRWLRPDRLHRGAGPEPGGWFHSGEKEGPLDPNLVRELEPGDTIPDGRPGTAYYLVEHVHPPHLLVLRSWTHIPPGWDDRFGVRIHWTWCFDLTEVERGRTRVHLRVRGRTDPRWFTLMYVVTLVPADLVMATGMLRGLRERAEAGAPPEVSGRMPLPWV